MSAKKNSNAKTPVFVVKLQIGAGKANPAPPIGTALGPRGVNIMEFCRAFNDRTKDLAGATVGVVINIYKDKTFNFTIKGSPVSHMIKDVLALKVASKQPGILVVAKLTAAQVREIAKKKMVDTNAYNLEAVVKMVEGTARSMGIEVEQIDE
jgi:large subunit ribosomal protein L11